MSVHTEASANVEAGINAGIHALYLYKQHCHSCGELEMTLICRPGRQACWTALQRVWSLWCIWSQQHVLQRFAQPMYSNGQDLCLSCRASETLS